MKTNTEQFYLLSKEFNNLFTEIILLEQTNSGKHACSSGTTDSFHVELQALKEIVGAEVSWLNSNLTRLETFKGLSRLEYLETKSKAMEMQTIKLSYLTGLAIATRNRLKQLQNKK